MNSTNVLEKPASPCVPCVCLPCVCRQPCRQPQQSQEVAGVPALARTVIKCLLCVCIRDTVY